MDQITARFECLKLATEHGALANKNMDADGIQKVAVKWSDFVIGEKRPESKSQMGKQGADDHLAQNK